MIPCLNHITLAVTDLEKSFSFYQDLLGFNPVVKWDRGAYFLVGDYVEKISNSELWFCLNVDEKRQPNNCYTHYAFTVLKKDFNVMRKKLLDAEVISFQENTSPGDSFYFLDPDGHKLELHVGKIQDRLAAKKVDCGSWNNIQWFV